MEATVAGRDLTASSIVNVKSNKSIDMSIATQTFTVKSVPTGVVYINDEKVGTLDNAVTLQDNNYVVEPKWQGLISKSDAATLFDDNYNDPDGNDYLIKSLGSANKISDTTTSDDD